jgi:hypothetical protein
MLHLYIKPELSKSNVNSKIEPESPDDSANTDCPSSEGQYGDLRIDLRRIDAVMSGSDRCSGAAAFHVS